MGIDVKSHASSVHRPKRSTDSGICVFRYALGLASLTKQKLTVASFDLDGHDEVFSSSEQFRFDDDGLTRLRDECLHLLCNVAEQCSLLSVGTRNNDASPNCTDSQVTDKECCSETCSSFCASGMETDDSSSMSNDCEDDGSDEDYIDDGSAALGSSRESSQSYVITSETDNSQHVDKLICPGDVVQYRLITSTKIITTAAIVAIQDNNDQQYILLDNGFVLRPHEHTVRKVKMYCGANGHLIPNHLAQWHDVHNCILQSGSLLSDEEITDEEMSHIDSDTDSNSAVDDDLVLQNDNGQRLRTSEGLTNNIQTLKMRKLRRENKTMNAAQDFHSFEWCEMYSEEYYTALEDVNEGYRNMLQIGMTKDAFWKKKKNVANMLTATTKKQFKAAKKAAKERYNRYVTDGKTVLKNFAVDTELLPDPRKYINNPNKPLPTRRQIIVKEQILTHEHYLESLNILKCSVCMECVIESSHEVNNQNFTCSQCNKRKDPTFFTDNNLHPVWYLVDDKGDYVRDGDGEKIARYTIPPQLSCLSMAEKLLIRRCANFVPSVHLKGGVFALKGHCVTFPQDITDMCDELPQRKETILTFVRNIGNKNSDSVYPVSLRVNKTKVIAALTWLKIHNPFYKNIKIKKDNLDWMGTENEVNIGNEAVSIQMTETKRSQMAEEEEEHVSKSNSNMNDDGDDNDEEMVVHTMHANTKQSIPSGRQAEPIKELIQIAKDTNQMQKVMNWPPIDHDSPIS